ncbi:MAG: hypothetical protein JWM10_401, partial [Myxococcaceae bacterium]|nr:hypothetical protein [Myxococcaceae bacterium]
MTPLARAFGLSLALAACRGTPSPDAAVARDVLAVDAGVDVPIDAPADAPVDAGAPANRVVVTLTGDIMLHRGVMESFADHAEQGAVAWTLGWLASFIAPREVALTWLDSPLTDAHRPPFTGAPPALGVPRALARPIARDLARVGLDGVCLA